MQTTLYDFPVLSRQREIPAQQLRVGQLQELRTIHQVKHRPVKYRMIPVLFGLVNIKKSKLFYP